MVQATRIFSVTANTLSDNSDAYDVIFSAAYCGSIPAQSEYAAEELAYALNHIAARFLDCGSDREVNVFACELAKFIKANARSI